MTGEGRYQFGKDRFLLKVKVTGHQDCEVTYDRRGDDASVAGGCDNITIAQRGAADPTIFARENPRELLRPARAR
jgi:hypothetical protein